MKVLKIFIRLKLEEIWEGIKAVLPYFLSICFIIILMIFLEYVKKNFTTGYLVMKITGITLTCIFTLGIIIALFMIFIDWIKNNWEKAKRIANKETK